MRLFTKLIAGVYMAAALAGTATAQPSSVSVSPASGTGTTQTFAFTSSSPNGSGYIQVMFAMFDYGVDGGGACFLAYYPGNNSIALAADDGWSWSPSQTLGSSGTLQNSQCAINLAAATHQASGNSVTVNTALTFKAGLPGLQRIYMITYDNGGLASGWQQLGTWDTNTATITYQAPALLPPQPANGTGLAQTFTLRASSVNGYAYLTQVQVSFNSTPPAANFCWVYYNRLQNYLYLMNDSQTAWLTAHMGDGGVVSNSQCSVYANASNVGSNGANELDVNVAIAFNSSWTGPKSENVYAEDRDAQTVGWTQEGTWTVGLVAQPPASVSVSPSSGTGTTQTFAFTSSSPNGSGYIQVMFAMFDYGVDGGGACFLAYYPASNSIGLAADDGWSWSPTQTLGGSGTLQNSQCAFNLAASTAQASGNSITVNTALTFKAGLPGLQRIYVITYDNGGLASGWQQLGTWDANTATITYQAPVLLAPQPANGAGLAQTFTLRASSVNGYAYLTQLQVNFTSTPASLNSCWVYYNRLQNYLYLMNDSQTAWLTAHMGNGGVVSNSQCSVNANASSVSPNGANELDVNVAIAFNSSWTGPKSESVYTEDRDAQTAGWTQEGTWTVGPPDFTLGAAPSSATVVNGSSAPYTVTIGSVSGFSGIVGFTIAGLPTGATAGFNPSTVTGSGSTTLTISTATGGPTGAFPLTLTAISGALSHALSPTLVTQGPPDFTLGVTPASISLLAGTSTTAAYTLTVAPVNTFAGTVNFSVSGFPAGTGASFLPSTITGSGSTSLRINSVPWLSAGDYPLTITASSGSLAHTASATLRVQDFSLSISLPSQSVACNGSAQYTVTATSINGFSGAIAFDSLPPYTNTSESYSPTVLYNGSGTTTLTVTTFIGPNCNSITPQVQVSGHTGQSPPSYRYTSASLAINTGSAPDYSITVTPSSSAVTPPGNAAYTIAVNPVNGFSGTVGFTVLGPPAGVSPSFNSVGNTTTLTLSAAAGTQPGVYPITIGSTSGSLNRSANATLTIQAGPDFSIMASPASQTVGQSRAAVYTITVNASAGFSGTVDLSTGALPAGATGGFLNPTVTGSGTASLAISTTASTPPGAYAVTITGLSGPIIHTTKVFMTVSAPAPASMIAPAPGAILTSNTAIFAWDSGSGVSQYQLSLGSAPGGSDRYFASTGTNQQATVSLPSASQLQTVYATLGSLIAGNWQYRSYIYSLGPSPTQATAPVMSKAAQAPVFSAYNDNQPTLVGPLYTVDCQVGSNPCIVTGYLNAGYVTDCHVVGHPEISAVPSAPSQSDAASWSSLDVTLQVPRSVLPGNYALACTWAGQQLNWGDGSVGIYDATPQITAVDQYPPDSPGGPFYVTLYGSNLGGQASGVVTVCASGANPCTGTPDITTSLSAQYSFWGDNQVNLLVQPSTNASGVYNVILTSLGAGLVFVAGPLSASQSNRAQVNVNPSGLGISIWTADVASDQITVALSGPQTATGTLTVTLQGPSTTTLASETAGPGTHTYHFGRATLAAGQYTAVQAVWTVSSYQLQAAKSVSFNVLGSTRFSTYNTPYESSECGGSPQWAYVFTDWSGAYCYYRSTTLDSEFMSQTTLNGTGMSLLNGLLKAALAINECSYPAAYGSLPAGNQNNTYYLVPSVTGKCNKSLTDQTSIATNPDPTTDISGKWQCKDSVLAVNNNNQQVGPIKQVLDLCPACSTPGHVDTYSSSQKCSAHDFSDYGTFQAIRLR